MRENPVRTSARWVTRQARYVRLDEGRLHSLAHRLEEASLPSWEGRYHFRGDEELTCRYLLVLDALNFCFWPGKVKWTVPGPEGEPLTGYFALAYALRKAAEKTPDFYQPRNLAALDEGGLGEVLGGIPLPRMRARAAREVGLLLSRFGSAREFFLACAAPAGGWWNLSRLISPRSGMPPCTGAARSSSTSGPRSCAPTFTGRSPGRAWGTCGISTG
ncbi:hypothetical protein H5T52_05545 [Candidatus Bipolaricaulota bacterium]|nr:hypothetical protein [Candidatus Bipolaricaulota bacterium]